jgi:hypothetical protein
LTGASIFQFTSMARKLKGFKNGGARPGAGRKPGSKNRKTVLAELLPKLAAEDVELPLYRLLRRIRDPEIDERYRDVLAIATLPFLHPRMRSDLTAKPFFMMSPEELDQVEAAELEHEKQVGRSRAHIRLIPRG